MGLLRWIASKVRVQTHLVGSKGVLLILKIEICFFFEKKIKSIQLDIKKGPSSAGCWMINKTKGFCQIQSRSISWNISGYTPGILTHRHHNCILKIQIHSSSDVKTQLHPHFIHKSRPIHSSRSLLSTCSDALH